MPKGKKEVRGRNEKQVGGVKKKVARFGAHLRGSLLGASGTGRRGIKYFFIGFGQWESREITVGFDLNSYQKHGTSRQVGAPGQGPPVMVRISLGSGRADFRISSTLIEFSKFSFHSDFFSF